MSILNKISRWYFSKASLPYWCVLALDSLILVITAFATDLFVEGVHYFTPYTGPIVLGILVVLVVFVVLWRLLRTYSGIIRFSSFVDLERVAFANALASLIAGLIAFALDRFNVPASYIMMPSYLCILFIFVAATLLMWMERVIVKTLYDVFRREQIQVSMQA